jgi:hypothetical protein
MKEAGEEVNESELANLELIEERGIEAVDSAVLESITEQALVNSDEATTANLVHDLQVRRCLLVIYVDIGINILTY